MKDSEIKRNDGQEHQPTNLPSVHRAVEEEPFRTIGSLCELSLVNLWTPSSLFLIATALIFKREVVKHGVLEQQIQGAAKEGGNR
jgi:hypothetical protein